MASCTAHVRFRGQSGHAVLRRTRLLLTQSGHQRPYMVGFPDCRRPWSQLEDHMRRRDFIKVIAGLAAGWPLVVRAQSPSRKIYRLGILQPGKPPEPLVDDVLQRLKELGYREGHNIAYEYRWAEGTRKTSEVADCCSSAYVQPVLEQRNPLGCIDRGRLTTLPSPHCGAFSTSCDVSV